MSVGKDIGVGLASLLAGYLTGGLALPAIEGALGGTAGAGAAGLTAAAGDAAGVAGTGAAGAATAAGIPTGAALTAAPTAAAAGTGAGASGALTGGLADAANAAAPIVGGFGQAAPGLGEQLGQAALKGGANALGTTAAHALLSPQPTIKGPGQPVQMGGPGGSFGQLMSMFPARSLGAQGMNGPFA